jgi:hypothetical protein
VQPTPRQSVREPLATPLKSERERLELTRGLLAEKALNVPVEQLFWIER